MKKVLVMAFQLSNSRKVGPKTATFFARAAAVAFAQKSLRTNCASSKQLKRNALNDEKARRSSDVG